MIRAHTYSVVMRDPETGRFGVAVQSHWFNVGRIVPWVRPGVGAVATQSMVDPRYGLRGLELMRSGLSAMQVLETLVSEDPSPNIRQVAMIVTFDATNWWLPVTVTLEADPYYERPPGREDVKIFGVRDHLLADLAAIENGRSIVPSGWQGDFEAFHLRHPVVGFEVDLAVVMGG